MTTKYAYLPKNSPKGYKYQMAIKYANIFHSIAFQNIPKLGFL
jgi:hypothetical protein